MTPGTKARRTPPPKPFAWLIWLWAIPFAALAFWVLLAFTQPGWAWYKWINDHGLGGVVGFVPLFVVIGITGYVQVRLRRKFAASEGRMCTKCAHSLVGIGDVGVCPECGEGFHTEVDRVTWKNAGFQVPRLRDQGAKAASTPPRSPA